MLIFKIESLLKDIFKVFDGKNLFEAFYFSMNILDV